MIKRQDEMNVLHNEHMKGGNKTVHITKVVEQDEINGKSRLIAKITLESGASIGEHTHIDEEEIFYIIKGSAVYDDNGKKEVLNVGDSCVCLGGQKHSISNESDETCELMAVILLYK
jgi:quercetin dioxygenase-like cupin family protein